ncbi:MAG: MmgE/PrpD family protein [Rhizobacter sp.]|nr:MmgE/PrpD family protein [Rhizobacter sp.]
MNDTHLSQSSNRPDAATTPVTAELVRRLMDIATGPLDDSLMLLAKQCVLDWVGVALVGANEPLARMLLEQALEDGGRPVASIVGATHAFSPRQAALVNGATGHAIDYDDANNAALGHVTAAVLPAALAVAQLRQGSGDQLLRAFIAGYETAGMVGSYVTRSHYDRGFHGTGTIGSFGAAAAAAVLFGLNADDTAAALGIAGTQASGLKAQFGTMCKPLHAGKAAENGVVAAQLAARGFSSRQDLLEATQGFAFATSPTSDAEAAFKRPHGGHHLRSNLFKYHAACYGTHAALEAVGALRREHALRGDDIRRIRIQVEPGADRMCNIAAPTTGLQAKFSLRFNAALAIAGEDTASPSTYDDAMTQRADLCRLRDKVVVELMPPDWPINLARVTVETNDGRVLNAEHDSGVPCDDLQTQGDRLLHKFMMLTTPLVGDRRAREIADRVLTLDRATDLRGLTELLRGPAQ